MKRGSRYWRGVYMIQFKLTALVVLVTLKAPGSLPEMIGVLGLIVTTAYGGGAWVNARERDPEFQRATAERESKAAILNTGVSDAPAGD